MSDSASPGRVLILGGTSKVWRLMQPFWAQQSQGLTDTLVTARRAAPGVDARIGGCGAVEFLPQCKAVISLWGKTAGSADELAVNRFLARRAVEIARAVGADRVLHASSGAIYAPALHKLDEDAMAAPRHPYGKSKLDAEQAVPDTGPLSVFLRLGNVAGADSLFAALRRPEPLVLDWFATGAGPARSYIAPDDLARVLIDFSARRADSLPPIVNIAGPRPVQMEDIVRACGREPHFREAPAGALPIQHLDVSLLKGHGHELTASAEPAHLARFFDPGAET